MRESEKSNRPTGIKWIMLLSVIIAVLLLPPFAIQGFLEITSAHRLTLLTFIGFLSGALAAASAFGLWRRARWSYMLTIATFFVVGVTQFGVLFFFLITVPLHVWTWETFLKFSLSAIPQVVFISLSVIVIIYLLKPQTKKYFSCLK